MRECRGVVGANVALHEERARGGARVGSVAIPPVMYEDLEYGLLADRHHLLYLGPILLDERIGDEALWVVTGRWGRRRGEGGDEEGGRRREVDDIAYGMGREEHVAWGGKSVWLGEGRAFGLGRVCAYGLWREERLVWAGGVLMVWGRKGRVRLVMRPACGPT